MSERQGRSLLILGSPRSGTSCTAGCVFLCGVSLGKKVSPVKDQYNEKGYFENQVILDFNCKCVQLAGVSWDCPTELPLQQLAPHRSEFLQILGDQFVESVFAIKDHRIALLQNLYLDGLTIFGTEIYLLIVKRGVGAVIKSLQRRHPRMSADRAAEIYHEHYRLYDQIDKPRYEIQFEELVASPIDTMKGFCDFFGVEFVSEKSVAEFTESRLVHG